MEWRTTPIPCPLLPGFNVTTPLKAWNAATLPPCQRPALRFNVTTPLKAWNDQSSWLALLSLDSLQCDHAVEGVEWPPLELYTRSITVLQCDHAVEGVECLQVEALPAGAQAASM